MAIRFQSTLILLITMFLVMVGFGIIFPILPFFSINLGATPFQIGMLMASYSLMQFIFAPFWGSLSDRYGRRPIILIGLGGVAITFILFWVATNLFTLFASRILGGILSSACLPTVMAYMADVTSEEERGAGMGLIGAAMGLGIIVGPAIGGIFSQFHFSFPFFFSAGLAFINLIFATFFLKESKTKQSKPRVKYNRIKHLLSLKGFIAFIFLLVFVVSFSISAMESTFSLFAKDRLNFGVAEIGWIFAGMGVVGVIVQGFFIGKLTKRFGEEFLIKAGLFISALGYSLIIFASNLPTLMVFVILASLGQGLCRPSMASLISKDTEFEEGVTMGTMQSVDSLGRILGPVLGGLAFEFHYAIPYLSSGFLNFVFGLILSFI